MHDHTEPSTDELQIIESNWPLTQAELDVTTAECRLAESPDDELAQKALRRAQRRLDLTLRNLCETHKAGEKRAA